MSKDLSKNEVNTEDVVEATAEKKAKKPVAKKPNIFKRIWKKIVKLCKDTVGEMKKVVWLPKAELAKSTKLVVVTVVAIAAAIAVIDTAFSFLINGIAGLIG
jgi:preprotein translocase SecE subunit